MCGTAPYVISSVGFDWSGPPASPLMLQFGQPAASSLYVEGKGEEIVLIVVNEVTFIVEEEHPSSQFL